MGNYIDPVVARLEELLPDCEPELVRMYAVLALTLGASTTEHDVHDAWAVWRATTNPTHPALVPFPLLSAEQQHLDVQYALAIRQAAELVP